MAVDLISHRKTNIMCTFYEFINLDLAHQIEKAKEKALLVNESTEKLFKTQMYQFENFCLEIIVCEKTKKIVTKNVYHQPSLQNFKQ